MSRAQLLSVVFGAGEKRTLPGGRFFFIKSATAAVNVTLRGSGAPSTFQGITAGSKYRELEGEGFRFLDIESLVAQTVEIVIADSAEFDVANVVTVAGSVAVAEAPSTSIASVAPVSAANAAQTVIVAANAARKRVTLQADEAAGGSVFLRRAGGANNLLQMQPGVAYEIKTTEGLDVRNDTGAAVNIYRLEES